MRVSSSSSWLEVNFPRKQFHIETLHSDGFLLIMVFHWNWFPDFITTSPAEFASLQAGVCVTHFLRQLRNYPRSIFWIFSCKIDNSQLGARKKIRESFLLENKKKYYWAVGDCGSVGRAVASGTRGTSVRIQSSAKLIWSICLLSTVLKRHK